MNKKIHDYSSYGIYYKDELILNNSYKGRKCILNTDNNSYYKTDIEKDLYIICTKCKEKRYLKNPNLVYYIEKENRTKYCFKCANSGENNPFYGKVHSDQSKNKISIKAKERDISGENNPFYGKTHSKETRELISKKLKERDISGENNPFYGKTHSEETKEFIRNKNIMYQANLNINQKEKLSLKLSEKQKEIYNRNPEKYIKNKQRANEISLKSQKRYKMNNIEKKVLNELEKLNINQYFEYSVILNFMQFDFGCKKHKILLEIHGDYWHGNPALYNKNGTEGKIKLNEIQIEKISKDKEKYKFAIENNFKIFYIWEKDIKAGNFEVLQEIYKILT